jgi:serine protease AprX
MKNIVIILLLCVSFSLSGAEPEGNIYWIQLNTKAGTPFSINHPEKYLSQRAIERREKHGIAIDSTDLPVNPAFTDSLHRMGFFIKHTSRWMNGLIAIYNDTISIDSIKVPSFVASFDLRKPIPLKSTFNKFDEIDSSTVSYYGNATSQITMLNGDILHKYSKGEGVHIAVIDAGFSNSDKIDAFDSLYSRNGVLGTYDFVNPGNNVYNEHDHGTNVLSIMASVHPGTMIGSAPYASYWLLRSEDVGSEFPVEEDYWVVATEFADSVGCDVINTSLGYTTFIDPSFDHNYGEFSGDSMRISKVANLAVKKGIVVVCSAGNDGAAPWKYICTPSEARDVLCVAAVNSQRQIAKFSSRGFGIYSTINKPDVAAMGSGASIVSAYGDYSIGSGTSFSSPVMAGMAACLVGAFPDSSAYSIIQMIRKAGNLYPEHNDSLGYGIPDFAKYIDQIKVNKTEIADLRSIKVFPNPFSDYIHLYSNNKIEGMEILSFDGRIVYTAAKESSVLHGEPITSLSTLPKGIYFVRVRDTKSLQTIKLIKN